jgi:hypothetical protein
MIEILNFKKGAKIIKLNATVTNFYVWGNLMCYCGRDKNMEKNHLTGQKAAERTKGWTERCMGYILKFWQHNV